LLGSGSPHVPDAVGAVAAAARAGDGARLALTPLSHACRAGNWQAALALLAAGARVDIAGYFGDRVQTAAQWARDSWKCAHRGLQLAIAARAREHAAEAETARRSSQPRPLAAPVSPPAVREAAPGSRTVDGDTGPRVVSVVAEAAPQLRGGRQAQRESRPWVASAALAQAGTGLKSLQITRTRRLDRLLPTLLRLQRQQPPSTPEFSTLLSRARFLPPAQRAAACQRCLPWSPRP